MTFLETIQRRSLFPGLCRGSGTQHANSYTNPFVCRAFRPWSVLRSTPVLKILPRIISRSLQNIVLCRSHGGCVRVNNIQSYHTGRLVMKSSIFLRNLLALLDSRSWKFHCRLHKWGCNISGRQNISRHRKPQHTACHNESGAVRYVHRHSCKESGQNRSAVWYLRFSCGCIAAEGSHHGQLFRYWHGHCRFWTIAMENSTQALSILHVSVYGYPEAKNSPPYSCRFLSCNMTR